VLAVCLLISAVESATAASMEQSTLNTNANSVAPSRSGSAGATRISVNPATQGSVQVTMCLEFPKLSSLNAQVWLPVL
jgi:hypothetical protein